VLLWRTVSGISTRPRPYTRDGPVYLSGDVFADIPCRGSVIGCGNKHGGE
jgi:hypothetical protein